MRKFLALVVLVFLAFGLLAGCKDVKQTSRDSVVYADWQAGNRSVEEVGMYLYTQYVCVAEQRFPMAYIGDVSNLSIDDRMALVCAFRDPDATSLTLPRKEMEEELNARFGVVFSIKDIFRGQYDSASDTVTYSSSATAVDLTWKGAEVLPDGAFAVTVALNAGTANAYEKVYTFRMNEGTFRLESCVFQNFARTEWTAAHDSKEDALYRYVELLITNSFNFFPLNLKEIDYYGYFRFHFAQYGLEEYRSKTDPAVLNVPVQKLLSLAREVFVLEQEPDPATLFGAYYHADTKTVDLHVSGLGGDSEKIYWHQIRLDGVRLEVAYSMLPYGEKMPDGTDAKVYHAVFEKDGTGVLSVLSCECPES